MSEIVDWLESDHGRAAVAAAGAARAANPDPLAIAKQMSRLELPASYRQAATLQADLRARLIERWGSAPNWLLTRDGIEQATPPQVRLWRATRLRELGVSKVADLGCGLGFESESFSAAGMSGYAIDRDLEVAAVASRNLKNSGFQVLQFDIVSNTDAMDAVLQEVDAVFIDPARRDPNAARSADGRSGNRVTDPEDWSPSWNWVRELAQRQPRLVAKVAPGIDKALIPAEAQTTWFAMRGQLVEASVWFGGFGLAAGTQAIAVDRHGETDSIDSSAPVSEAIGEVGRFLLDPSPAVTRAGLVTALADRTGSHRLDPMLAFLSCEVEPDDSPLYATYEVLEALSFEEDEIAIALARHAARDVQVRARGWGGDIDALTARLKKNLAGDKVVSLLIARVGDSHTAVLAQRLN